MIDVNDDGWLDLYLTNMQGDDQYDENAGGKRFVNKSRQIFPRTSWGAMGIKAFDYNNDGRLDLFITDMHSDMSDPVGPERDHLKSDMKWPEDFRGSGKTSIWGNSFFRKDGPGKYTEVSDAIGVENYCPWGPSIGDLNADGFDDAFIAAGMNYPERYMINSVKLNDRGQKFVDAEFALGVEPRQGGLVTPFFELDATGKDKEHRDAEGATGPALAIWGARGSRSAAIFDVDGDGDLDIVTNEFNAAPMVLLSNLSEKTRVRYVAVRLAGTTSNRMVGAGRQGDRRDVNLYKVMDGKFRISVAQPVAALLRAWRERRRRSHRGGVAVGQEAGGAGSDQDRLWWSTFESRKSARRATGSGARFYGAVADVGGTAAPAKRTDRRSAGQADRMYSPCDRSRRADRPHLRE